MLRLPIGNIGPIQGGKPVNRYTNFGAIPQYSNSNITNYSAAGYGSLLVLTPKSTGKLRIRATGIWSYTGAGSGKIYGIYYGTGAAPAQGTLISGFAGTKINTNDYLSATLNNSAGNFAIEGEVSNLPVNGTPHWFDIITGPSAGTNITIQPASFILEEF